MKEFESILSLLVKIHYKNTMTDGDGTESNIELAFLSPKSSKRSDDLLQNRIGDENDFIYNLLEKSALACDKCKLHIEKSLEYLTI